MTGWHDTQLRTGPTIILGRKGQGPLGVKWCDGPFWVIDTAYYTTFAAEVDPKFFFYFTDLMGLNHLKDGTSNPSLTRDVFGRQDFPLPPITEQREIAAILRALDDKIELNRKTAATLEAMARALLVWFVDFDPVWAKTEGRPPAHMDPTTAALFPDGFDDEGLPLGWPEGVVEDLFVLQRGFDLPASTRSEESLSRFRSRRISRQPQRIQSKRARHNYRTERCYRRSVLGSRRFLATEHVALDQGLQRMLRLFRLLLLESTGFEGIELRFRRPVA